MSRIIEIAAALLTGPDGRTLLVRKQGTQAFMQPGGKIDADETALNALVRELEEELGLAIDPAGVAYLGRFEAPAANEAGAVVIADIFHVETGEDVRPAAEIAEAIWVDQDGARRLPLAPLTRDCVLPLLGRVGPAT